MEYTVVSDNTVFYLSGEIYQQSQSISGIMQSINDPLNVNYNLIGTTSKNEINFQLTCDYQYDNRDISVELICLGTINGKEITGSGTRKYKEIKNGNLISQTEDDLSFAIDINN